MNKPLDDDFYGIEFQVGKGYDFFTTSAYEFLWQHGGDIWDETKQPNAHALGVMNSDTAVKSFDHLLSLRARSTPRRRKSQIKSPSRSCPASRLTKASSAGRSSAVSRSF